MNNTTQPLAWVINDVPYKDWKYVIDVVQSYCPLRYYVVFEHPHGGYPHYHFLVWFTLNNYNALIKRFILKYKLKGKTKGGQRGQYRKLTKIDDMERLQTYMAKDWDTNTEDNPTRWTLNMKKDDMERFIKNSFKKNEATETCYKCIKYVKENVEQNKYKNFSCKVKQWNSQEGGYIDEFSYEKQAKLLMIEFHINKKLRINKTTINNYYIEYLKTNHYDDMKDLESTTHAIYDKLFE